MSKSKYSSFKKYQTLTENFRRFVNEGKDFDKVDAAEHARKHWATREEEEEEEEDELDLMGMQFDASEEQMDWARNMEEGDDESLDEVTAVRGFYRTSLPEMQDMLMKMAYEFEDRLRDGTLSPQEAITAAVDAMEKRVDDGEFSSRKWSSEQVRKYYGKQQFLTGREAYRKMMSDVGNFILDSSADTDGDGSGSVRAGNDSDIAHAVDRVLKGAKGGRYSVKNYHESKKRKGKGKKTSLLEIRRRLSKARRKQNK